MFDVLSISALAPVAPATGGADMSAEDGDFGALMKALAGAQESAEAGDSSTATADTASRVAVSAASGNLAGGTPRQSIALIQGEGKPSDSEAAHVELNDQPEDAIDPASASDESAKETESPNADEITSTSAIADETGGPFFPSSVAIGIAQAPPVAPSMSDALRSEAEALAEGSPEAVAPRSPDDKILQTAEASSARVELENSATSAKAGATPVPASQQVGASAGAVAGEPGDVVAERARADRTAAQNGAPDMATGGAGSRSAAAAANPADPGAQSALARVLVGAGVTRVVAKSAEPAKDVATPSSAAPLSPSSPSSSALPVTNPEVANRVAASEGRLAASDHQEPTPQAAIVVADGDVTPDVAARPALPQSGKAVSPAPAPNANDVAARTLADASAPTSGDIAAASLPPIGGATGSTTATAVTSMLSSISAATAETTAALGAQILRRLEGRSTRFEIGLTPEGLGQVDVTLEIDAEGGLSARLAFDSPISAAELRGRADELRRHLQEAGFSVAQDALSFSERDPGQSGGGNGRSAREFLAESARAFAGAERLADAAETASALPAWAARSQTPSGVDVKV